MTRPVAACPIHERLTRAGQMVHDIDRARAEVDRDIAYITRHGTGPGFLAMLITDTGPLCCPSAGLAREVMRAAWRQRLAGEGDEPPLNRKGT